MWSSGDVVAYRFVRYGAVRYVEPSVVVTDADDLVALHVPVGTRTKVPVWAGRPIRGQADRRWTLRDHPWNGVRSLRLVRWDAAYSLILFWEDASDEFTGWYVNIEEPLRRSAIGFDTDDLILDIRVDPDGTWTWKDEDELEEAVTLGRFTPAEATAIRAVGERVLEDPPWPTGWEDWRPDPAWPVPVLPSGWDVV